MTNAIRKDSYVDAYGITRWRSNDQVPPQEVLEDFRFTTDQLKTHKAFRDIDTEAFLIEYRRAQANRTPEQIAEQQFEARAAFGPGEEIVNVVTGERYTT